MTTRGAQPGNKNAAKDRPWEKALRAVVAQYPDRVRRIALKVFDLAEGGDVMAIRELFDRLDGKMVQRVEASGPDGGPIELTYESGTVRSRLAEIFAGVETGRDPVADDGRGPGGAEVRLGLLVAGEPAAAGE